MLSILRTKPFLVSQFGVESVISALIQLATPGTQHFLRPHAARVHRLLSQITSTIVSLHRKHIGGRMHLLVPLLQALLNCLFSTHVGSTPARNQRAPSWIHSRQSGLDSSHGTDYAKVLLTLTEPTVSSAMSMYRSRNNPMLTDEIRKARKYAAQYVPYVLAHFCGLHLNGSLTPEIRKSLMPGIWACVQAVPREGLKGMNAGMRPDERAIWSSLWAEYNRTRR
ncbi:hypothetical protein BT63DRAFT_87966 [Microthyrium microscopicum]|uniref:Nucleolar 27S pre-rRNA processing Urb2/Npa2 C-terminal domain-containing protein n=1 Tax=Microthyrium microscopicum TaxID=703497 RepID=A0A6A6U266_9PEZI|nr:hypothetical protein BT63DRAFT_87966 [Microthyrium microscopicum]